ncbi:MAG: hypothetical protein JRF63_09385, partial [Deltaproteobacteria bacterium]|nr:hypothetical protein [Deltaproteobacteria bacterium]
MTARTIRRNTSLCAALTVVAFSILQVAAVTVPGRAPSLAEDSTPVISLPTRVLYVDTGNSACDDSGPGTLQVPYCTIQAGYDAAVNGDELRVMPGTYAECVMMFDLATQKGVSIVADAFAVSGDNTSTVIDASTVPNCVFPQSGQAAAVVNIGGYGSKIEGFTITGGSGSGIFGVGPVTITNNVVRDNDSNFGGGIYVYTASCYYGDTNIQVTNNTVTNNTANLQGGGISIAAGLRDVITNPGGACLQDGNGSVNVEGNVITGNASDADGGGILATTYADSQHSASVVITQNTITDNHASSDVLIGYGGGVYGVIYGYGNESIHVLGNTFSGNTTLDNGGGLSMVIVPDFNPADLDHEIRVEANIVTANQAGLGGGGIDLFVRNMLLSQSQSVRIHVMRNTVTGNTLTTDEPELTYGGGGIVAFNESLGSASPNIEFLLEHNFVVDNSAFGFGGGITLWVSADAEPFNDGYIAPAKAGIEVRNNWVVGNDASTNAPGYDGAGGGVFVLLEAEGDAMARVDMPLNTIAYNTLDGMIESGGIHAESYTRFDTASRFDGHAELILDSSIVSGNDGIGLGGPVPGQPGIITPGGTAEFNVGVTYNDFYGNTAGDVDGWIIVPPGNIFEDPLFVGPPDDVHLSSASPAIDAGNPQIVAGSGETDIDGDPRVLDGNGDGVEHVDMGADEFVNRLMTIEIDIKPDSYPNRVNPRSRGVIPVAL